SFVADRTASGSTPVASGSSVPRWPTRRVPSQRRAASTTSCEVQPPGLSTTRKPWGPGASRSLRLPLVIEPGLAVRVARRLELAQQIEGFLASLERPIVAEAQLGHALQRQLARGAPTQERGGALEPFLALGGRLLAVVSERAPENERVREIRSDIDARQ